MDQKLKESLKRHAYINQSIAPAYTKGIVNGNWWILKGTLRHLKCSDEAEASMMLELIESGLCDGCSSNDVIMASIRARG